MLFFNYIYILDINPLPDNIVCKYHLPFSRLFVLIMVPFIAQLFSFVESCLFIFLVCLPCWWKSAHKDIKSDDHSLSAMFSSMYFIVSSLMFKSFVHFKFWIFRNVFPTPFPHWYFFPSVLSWVMIRGHLPTELCYSYGIKNQVVASFSVPDRNHRTTRPKRAMVPGSNLAIYDNTRNLTSDFVCKTDCCTPLS